MSEMRRPSPLVMVLCILFFDMLCQGMAYPSMPSLIQELGGLTPAEAARLLGAAVDRVQFDRPAAARALAERYQSIAVLKGAGTLVAWPAATGSTVGAATAAIRLALNPTGSNRLATAGTGDVLSGLIGALLARGLDAPAAAQLGVWVHGRAGEQLSDERPTASGLLPILSRLLAGSLSGPA
jgi:NAD(P)H-hydrate repair Nnr-like enzyme with NAD(P)H-hydrate dehydratase domain